MTPRRRFTLALALTFLAVPRNRTLRAAELQQTIVHAATTFSGGDRDDDVTLVVVAVEP